MALRFPLMPGLIGAPPGRSATLSRLPGHTLWEARGFWEPHTGGPSLWPNHGGCLLLSAPLFLAVRWAERRGWVWGPSQRSRENGRFGGVLHPF